MSFSETLCDKFLNHFSASNENMPSRDLEWCMITSLWNLKLVGCYLEDNFTKLTLVISNLLQAEYKENFELLLCLLMKLLDTSRNICFENLFVSGAYSYDGIEKLLNCKKKKRKLPLHMYPRTHTTTHTPYLGYLVALLVVYRVIASCYSFRKHVYHLNNLLAWVGRVISTFRM